MVMKIRKALNYVLTIVLVTTLLMIGAAPVAADSGQPEQAGDAITPFQQAIQEIIEERTALGLAVPSVSYEYAAASVSTASGQETTINAKTVVYFASPEEAGFETWPNLIIGDLGPDDEGKVFEGGDYTQFVLDRLEQEYPGISEQWDFYSGDRTHVFEETLTITSPEQAPSAVSTSTSVDEILMGVTYEEDIYYTWGSYLSVDIPIYGEMTVYDIQTYFSLDWALGVRLPLEVGLTSPDSVNEGSTFSPTSYVKGVDWSASDFQQAGVSPYAGNEFVLRCGLEAGLYLILADINVFGGWATVGYSVDMSQSFKTPFGPGESFPIPDLEITLFNPSVSLAGWGNAGLTCKFVVDPILGSKRMTANWQAGGDGSGGGAITYTSPTSAVTLGQVNANDFSPSTDYAVVTVEDFQYELNKFLIDLSTRFTAWVDIHDPILDTHIWGDSWDLGSIPIYTFDLSALTGSLSLGVHPGTSGTVTKGTLVQNVAPVVNAGPDATVDEGSTFSSSGSFTDPGTDTWTATVDYGDGSPVIPLILNSNKTFDLNHVYADNGTYTVTVTVTDDDGGVGTDTAAVTVNNVAPTLDAGPDQEITAAYTVSLAPATFNDLGTLDTHTATIDWGDGTSTEAGIVTETPFGPPGSTAGMDGTMDGSHIYPVSGEYTVLVTVTDDNGGSIQDTLTVTVKPFPVSIDIKPGSNPNSINLNSKGVIPVAILTTPEFDASLVLADSIRFGPGEAPPAHYQLEDVDKDGDLDLILHFRTRLTGIESDATEASITGYSYDPLNRLIPPTAVSIKGTDSVRIVPPKGKK